jgi:hypothetical protein
MLSLFTPRHFPVPNSPLFQQYNTKPTSPIKIKLLSVPLKEWAAPTLWKNGSHVHLPGTETEDLAKALSLYPQKFRSAAKEPGVRLRILYRPRAWVIVISNLVGSRAMAVARPEAKLRSCRSTYGACNQLTSFQERRTVHRAWTVRLYRRFA